MENSIFHKLCRKCKKNKELVCFSRDTKHKDGLNTWCKQCSKEYVATYYIENSVKIKANSLEWQRFNTEKRKNITGKYYKSNSAECISRTLKWRRVNPAKCKAIKAKYRACKILATPTWLTKSQFSEIEQFYQNATSKTKMTGVVHNVDHIVPLQGKNVSGLHVPWNLQILSASENCKKSNKVMVL